MDGPLLGIWEPQLYGRAERGSHQALLETTGDGGGGAFLLIDFWRGEAAAKAQRDKESASQHAGRRGLGRERLAGGSRSQRQVPI